MKTTEISGNEERRILTGMIVDAHFLAQIAPRYTPECFKSKWSGMVGQWCVDHFNKYGVPPEAAIQRKFERWAQKYKDKDTIKLVESFLTGLSDDFAKLRKRSNTQHLLDVASEYFNEVRATKHAESILALLEAGEVVKATDLCLAWESTSISQQDGIDVLDNPDAFDAAFDEKQEPLLKFEDGLKMFFKGSMERGGFIAILAPEKRGKTWWLFAFALLGVMQGLNVALFSVGDMTQNQVLRRLAIMISKKPSKAKTVKIPCSIAREGDGSLGEEEKIGCDVGFEEKEFAAGLTKEQARKSIGNFRTKYADGGKRFKLATHPNSTLSVRGMEAQCDRWEKQGFVPDIIVLDYADILAMPGGQDDSRNQINKNWKDMRALSQKKNALFITATQADAEGGTTELLGLSNFSEDKRKFAHVSGMFGINQTDHEKRKGVQRLNWLVLREDEFVATDVVHVAGCLDIGQPFMLSTM